MSTQLINTQLILKPRYNVYLFQPQYCATIAGKRQYWVPYSVGCIWSYAQQFVDITNNFKLSGLIFRREKVENILEKFKQNPPDICGFSVYAWNEKYCMYVAEQIKKHYPACKMVFGGPQINSSTLENWFVDTIVLAEGEETFVKILRSYISGESIQQIYDKSRLTNLEIPSPYLTGVFDKIIAENPEIVWSAVLETNRGCPYQCTFCDWGSATYSKVRKFNLGRVAEELEWIEKNPIVFITNADANFGIYKERDLEIAKMIRHASDYGMVESVAVTYAKNSTAAVFEIAKVLGPMGRGVTVSVQSMNEDTLEAIKRKNMEVNDIRKMMELSEQMQIPTYTELILGLPNETPETWKNSITDLLELGQHSAIDAYLCILLRNSELNSEETRKKYGIESTVVYDYIAFTESADDEMILPEEFEIIAQTNTMSTEELIESYLYSWMIIHFHCMGYTQLYAKYCRKLLGVTYKKFYDTFFEMLKQDSVLSVYLWQVKTYLTEFLKNGYVSSANIKGTFLNTFSYPILHKQKDHIFDLAKNCFNQFNDDENCLSWLELIQKAMIYDERYSEDRIIEVPYDISSWEPIHTNYIVSDPATKKSKRHQAPSSTARNSAFLKNLVTKITSDKPLSKTQEFV